MTVADERFTQSLTSLTDRLRERMAGRPEVDPLTALRHRQDALKAYDRARQDKLIVILGGATSTVAIAALIWGIARFALPADERAVTLTTAAQAPPAVTLPASSPSEPVMVVSSVPPAERGTPAIEATAAPAPEAAPEARPLSRREVAEAQRLLAGFACRPGPVDGVAGRLTRDAVERYEKKRGLAPTGTLDRELLRRLREDPAPKIVVAVRRPAERAVTPQRRDDSGVFEPVRLAGEQITTWLNSVFR